MKKSKKAAPRRKTDGRPTPKKAGVGKPLWELRLYVAGQTANSLKAFTNLKRICEEHLKNEYSIEVIDLLENPLLARGEQIVALPTLVRKLPEPVRKIVGTLSDEERVLVGLDLLPRDLGRTG